NPARGHLWAAWIEVWDGLARLSGPVVPWAAVAAAIAIVASTFRRRDLASEAGSDIMILAIAACAILPWAAYYQGHPVRIRYDVPPGAAAAALIGGAVARLPRVARPVAGAAIVAIAIWQAPPFDRTAPVIVEARRVAAEDTGRTAVTAFLTAHWDGRPI